MRWFLTKIGLYLLILLALLIIITFGNKVLLRNSGIRLIEGHRNIMVLGDSHTKYALNDSIISNTINLSQDADSYFYTFYKLKYFAEANPQIDSVLLSFSSHNISKNIEERWLLNSSHLESRISIYLPLLEWSDFMFLLKHKPIIVITGLFTQVKCPLLILRNGTNLFGGYKKLDHNILQEEIIKLKLEEYGDEFENIEVSSIEDYYLRKIIDYCETQGLTLVLIGTPIHRTMHNHCSTLTSVYLKNYSTVPFLDFRKIKMKDEYFGDLVHLSPEGSNYFSEFIKEQLIQE